MPTTSTYIPHPSDSSPQPIPDGPSSSTRSSNGVETKPQLPVGEVAHIGNGSSLSSDVNRKVGLRDQFDLAGRQTGSRASVGFLLEPFKFVTRRKRKSTESTNTNIHLGGRRRIDDVGSQSEESSTSGRQPGSKFFKDGTMPMDGLPPQNDNSYNHHVVDAKGKGRAATPNSSGTTDSQQNSSPGSHPFRAGSLQSTSIPPALDPTLIVQMALSLGESRKMNLGPGYLASNGLAVGRRAVSAGVGLSMATTQGSFQNYGGSLRGTRTLYNSNGKSLQTARLSISRMRPDSPLSASPKPDSAPSQTFDLDAGIHISPATWTRAEKARAFFELSHEYRRLLNSLPPLKATAFSLSEQQDQGRPYNPLQYIRNRQVRAHERQVIDEKAAGWDNLQSVRAWVDKVELETQETDNRSGDVVLFPPWIQRNHISLLQDARACTSSSAPESAMNGSKPRWTKLDWSISPEALMADAFWLEQGRNKTLVENRKGHRIYDNFQAPRQHQPDEQIHANFEALGQSPVQQTPSPESSRDSQSPVSPEIKRTRTFSSTSTSPNAHRSNKAVRITRHLLGRHRDDRDVSPDSDASPPDLARVESFLTKGALQLDNTGPLERHMNRVLEAERRKPVGTPKPTASPDQHRDSHARRGGVSAQHNEDAEQDDVLPELLDADAYGSQRKSFETNFTETPRISVEDTDAMEDNDVSRQSTRDSISQYMNDNPKDIPIQSKSRRPGLNFFRSRGKKQYNIQETDFALLAESEMTRRRSLDSSRSSMESVPRSNSFLNLRILPSRREPRTKSQDEETSALSPSDSRPNSTTTRFFKGGRIGEIVRGERPGSGGFIWKKQAPRNGSSGSSKQSASETDEEEHPLAMKTKSKLDEHRRSQSTSDLKGNYHVKNLPTFRPTKDNAIPKDKDANLSDDHISRQYRAQLSRKQTHQSNTVAPSSINTRDVSISPNSSYPNLNLSRRTTTTASATVNDRERSRSPGDTRSSSRTGQLDSTFNKSGFSDADSGFRFPPTALSRLPTQSHETDRITNTKFNSGHRNWSIAYIQSLSDPQNDHTTTIGPREIAYVRALLQTSIVKANELVRRANSVRDPSTPFLISAATLSHASLTPVKRREEHVLAARLLSNTLSENVFLVESFADDFRSVSCTNMYKRIDEMREEVGSRLTPVVRGCADEADGFIARLTTTHTLGVKQVNDSVDALVRRRWRRGAWVARWGWKVLEWVVVGVMWGMWLGVLVLKGIRGMVVGVGRGVRLLF